MVSSGIYIPICKVIKVQSDGLKLDKQELKHENLNHYIFEDLYNLGLVGSRWLTVNEAETFYVNNNIVKERNNLILHTREFIDSKIKRVLINEQYTD